MPAIRRGVVSCSIIGYSSTSNRRGVHYFILSFSNWRRGPSGACDSKHLWSALSFFSRPVPYTISLSVGLFVVLSVTCVYLSDTVQDGGGGGGGGSHSLIPILLVEEQKTIGVGGINELLLIRVTFCLPLAGRHCRHVPRIYFVECERRVVSNIR